MYPKFLFVGLGGSGGKTLRFLKRELRHWQRDHGVDTPLPSGWQFINIDSRTTPDGAEIDHLAPPLDAGEYVGLIQGNMTLKAVLNKLDAQTHLQDELIGWRVDSAGPASALALPEGAGQFRAVGQTVAMAYAQEIHRALDVRLARLSAPDADLGLADLWRAVNGVNPGPPAGKYIVVISSLAGGTGAGCLHTVCDILRTSPKAGASGSQIFALLYTPEIFDSLQDAIMSGIQPNTLAAISELLNGSWRNDSDPVDMSEPLLAKIGLIPKDHSRGPTYPFLIGRQNMANVDLQEPDSVFEVTGRSLVAWITDPIVQSNLLAYNIAGYPAAQLAQRQGKILVNSGDDGTGLPQFLALGFGRVSLGTDYLEDYIVKGIVRYTTVHLVDNDLTSDEAKRMRVELGTTDRRVVARAIAEERRDLFLRLAHLSEYGKDENQIVDALRPEKNFEHELHQEVQRLTDSGNVDHKLSAHDWMVKIDPAMQAALRSLDRDYPPELVKAACEWIEAIEGHVLDAVEQQIAHHGLGIAAALCEVAATHLEREVHDELKDEAKVYADWWNAWKKPITRALDGIDGKISGGDPTLQSAISEAARYGAYLGEQHLAELAAQLCKEASSRLLRPIGQALLAEHQAMLATDSTASFPALNNQSPPQQFTPPITEFTLIDADDFPELFSDLLKKTLPKADTDHDRRYELRCNVAQGDFLDRHADYANLRCLRIQRHWWPRAQQPLDPARNAEPIAILVQSNVDHLADRARGWLHRKGTPFQTFLGHSLRSFLCDDDANAYDLSPQELQVNQTKFLAQLTSAINVSSPLLSLDPATYGLVHPGAPSDDYHRIFTTIPLASSAVESDVKKLLGGLGVSDSQVNAMLTHAANIKSVDITTQMHKPVSMLVVKSLLEPIAGAWASGQDENNFWAERVGKRLDKFVPIPQALLLCMARGWYTGVALGRIDKGDGYGAVQIARESDGEPEMFPHPFLSPPVDEFDTFARVAELLAVAFTEVSAQANLSPLRPYEELLALGRWKPSASPATYVSPHPALRQWFGQGRLQFSLVPPVVGDAPDDPAERAKSLARTFESLHSELGNEFQRLVATWSNDPDGLSKAPLWTGIWRHIERALRDLIAACDKDARTQSGSSRSPW